MDKRIIFLFAVIFIIGSVSAFSWPICIDTQAPEAPAGLIVSGNVQLTWNEAVDKPDCSEIEYYNIYLDGSLLGTSDSLSYSGASLSDGKYTFEISAVDKGGNEGDKIVKKVNFPISENNNDVSPGGGSTSSSTTAQLINLNNANCIEDWECSNWLDCVGGIQKKVCTDKNSCGTETNKPETEKECTVSQKKLGRGITGSVIGFAKSGVGTGLGMGILIILAGMGVIIFRNKKKAKKK